MTGDVDFPLAVVRPDLLVAMVSADVIVLAKIVRTLCPRELMVCGSAHARERGWTAAATAMLETLARDRPEVLERFRVIDLPQTALPARLDGFQRMLAEEASRIRTVGATIAFDCTTGQNIFHVLGFDTLHRLGAERGADVSVVYLDADSRSVVRASAGGDRIRYDQQRTEFRFRPGEEVSERFGMYGVEPRVARRLWPDDADPARHEALCRLYDALCQRADLRGLFHSHHCRLKRWKQRLILAGEAGDAQIGRLVRDGIEEIAAWVSGQTGQDGHQAFVRNGLAQVLDPLVPAGDVAAWLDHYLADKQLAGLWRRLNGYGQPLPGRLLPGPKNGGRRHDLGLALTRRLKAFVLDLRRALDHLAHSAGHDPSAFSAEDHRAFRAEQIAAMALPDDLGDLLRHEQKLPDLFEACVGAAVARAAAERFRDAVAVVAQNVELVKDARPIAELDTLILSNDADVAVLEAKTHFANAQLKKIEANIKSFRDHVGAYSRYFLVFPLTARDLADLLEGRDGAGARWGALGMEDHADWCGYLRLLGQTRDQRILGLDEVEQAVGRHGAARARRG